MTTTVILVINWGRKTSSHYFLRFTYTEQNIIKLGIRRGCLDWNEKFFPSTHTTRQNIMEQLHFHDVKNTFFFKYTCVYMRKTNCNWHELIMWFAMRCDTGCSCSVDRRSLSSSSCLLCHSMMKTRHCVYCTRTRMWHGSYENINNWTRTRIIKCIKWNDIWTKHWEREVETMKALKQCNDSI